MHGLHDTIDERSNRAAAAAVGACPAEVQAKGDRRGTGETIGNIKEKFRPRVLAPPGRARLISAMRSTRTCGVLL